MMNSYITDNSDNIKLFLSYLPNKEISVDQYINTCLQKDCDVSYLIFLSLDPLRKVHPFYCKSITGLAENYDSFNNENIVDQNDTAKLLAYKHNNQTVSNNEKIYCNSVGKKFISQSISLKNQNYTNSTQKNNQSINNIGSSFESLEGFIKSRERTYVNKQVLLAYKNKACDNSICFEPTVSLFEDEKELCVALLSAIKLIKKMGPVNTKLMLHKQSSINNLKDMMSNVASSAHKIFSQLPPNIATYDTNGSYIQKTDKESEQLNDAYQTQKNHSQLFDYSHHTYYRNLQQPCNNLKMDLHDQKECGMIKNQDMIYNQSYIPGSDELLYNHQTENQSLVDQFSNNYNSSLLYMMPNIAENNSCDKNISLSGYYDKNNVIERNIPVSFSEGQEVTYNIPVMQMQASQYNYPRYMNNSFQPNQNNWGYYNMNYSNFCNYPNSYPNYNSFGQKAVNSDMYIEKSKRGPVVGDRPLTPPAQGWYAKYSSGVTGVVWDRVHQAWVVSWTLAGKRTFRHFTCKSYGGFDKAREAAIEFRLARNKEIAAYNKKNKNR